MDIMVGHMVNACADNATPTVREVYEPITVNTRNEKYDRRKDTDKSYL